jgi:hypothetical protein
MAIFFNSDPSSINSKVVRVPTPAATIPGETSPIDHRVTPRAPGPVRLIPLFDRCALCLHCAVFCSSDASLCSSPNASFDRRGCSFDAFTIDHNPYFASNGLPFTAIPSYLDHPISPASTTSRRRTVHSLWLFEPFVFADL